MPVSPAITVGGTLRARLLCQRPAGPWVTFDLPFTATTDLDSAIGVTQIADELTFVGLRPGSATIRLEAPDGTTYASFRVLASYIDYIVAAAAVHEVIPADVELAFAAAYDTHAEVRLLNDSSLMDDDIVLVPPPGGVVPEPGAWPLYFTFDKAALGESTISVTSGGNTYTAPFVHLETADTITRIGTSNCFAAMNGTRYVQGLTWSYILEGTTPASSHTNCIDVHPTDDTNGDMQVIVDVSAGGATLHVRIPI